MYRWWRGNAECELILIIRLKDGVTVGLAEEGGKLGGVYLIVIL